MAERRMFAKTIIDSDAFLDMPMSTQCLYFHLAMRADDEGFLNNPKKVQRMVGASEDDLKAIDKDVRDIVADSADFAQADPEPDVSELWTDILLEA